jgi:hypothetical protein
MSLSDGGEDRIKLHDLQYESFMACSQIDPIFQPRTSLRSLVPKSRKQNGGRREILLPPFF